MSSLQILTATTKLTSLNKTQITELQRLLADLGLYRSTVDGIIGPLTIGAWHQFKQQHHQNEPDAIGPGSIKLLLQSKKQLDFSTAQGTRLAILAECSRQGLTLKTQKAYVLATVQWETANTWKPVKEAYWLSEAWRKSNLRYFPYYGRGYVQLTWKSNYYKYGQILGVNLVNQPDLALNPQMACFILVHGFKTGSFTGVKLEDYLNNSRSDFLNARRVINGTDKASQIAAIASSWLKFV